jgi:hypothetical protein
VSERAAELRELARQRQELAGQALAAIESALGQLRQDGAKFTNPAELAGEGNFGWFAHEIEARHLELSNAFDDLRHYQEELDRFLAAQGVVRPPPGRRPRP